MSEESKSPHFKVVFIGDPGVGKTCLIHRISSDDYCDDFNPTILTQVVEVPVEVGSQKIVLNVCDTAGQERFRSITSTYLRGTNIVIFVYSWIEKNTFESIKGWYDFIKNYINVEETQCFLVASKSDINGSEADQVSDSEGKEKAKSLNMIYFKTSAKTGNNTKELVNIVGQKCIELKNKNEPPPPSPVINNNKDKCC